MKQLLLRALSVVLATISVNAVSAQNGKLRTGAEHHGVQTHNTVNVPVIVPATTTTTTVTNGTVFPTRRYPDHGRKVRHDNGLHKGWYKNGHRKDRKDD